MLPPSPRLELLLAYLVLHRSAPVPRSQIAFAFWPDAPESGAHANLRQLLHRLRKLLPDADFFLAQDGQSVQWRPDAPFQLDVEIFEKALESATDAPQLSAALALYTGDLLPNCYDDWIAPLRARLRQKFLDGLKRLVALLEQQADYDGAVAAAQRLLAAEPLAEENYRRLMELYAHKRDRAAIEQTYRQAAELLQRELDLPPSPALEQSYRALLETAGGEQHRRLPEQPTPFVGRETEIAILAERIANPECRLLSLIGPGGIGKTRLALQLAQQQSIYYLHGVVYVPLVGVDDPNQLPSAVADGIGLRFQGNLSPERQVLAHLRDKQLLLVLDNYEHLLPETGWIERLLNEARSVKILLTSRKRLALRWEWLYIVPGLAVTGALHPGASAAVRLFTQTAQRVAPGFQPDEAEQRIIARICQAVGGMPLGIELAASWAGVFAPQEIADQITRSLDLLETASEDLPQRHRSLRAIFDSTWQLLSANEQQVLTRLSVFRGDFDWETAVNVTGATMPVLASLIEKCLVQRKPEGRYQLHELVQQYGAEKLATTPEEAHAVQDRLSAYYCAWLGTREALLHSARREEALAGIEIALGNAIAAWHWATSQGHAARLDRALEPFNIFYLARRRHREGRALCQTAADALRHAPAPEAQRVRGMLLVWLGRYSLILEQTDLAHQQVCESMALLEQLPADETRRERAAALLQMGHIVLDRGQTAEAERWYRLGLDLYRALNDDWNVANGLAALASVAQRTGDSAEAKRLNEQSLWLRSNVQAQAAAAQSMHDLAVTALWSMQLEEAASLLNQALSIYTAIGDAFGIAATHCYLGLHRALSLDYDASLELYSGAIPALRQMEMHRMAALWTVHAAYSQLSLGWFEVAQSRVRHSLSVAETHGDIHLQAAAQLALAWVALAEQQYSQAEPLLVRAAALFDAQNMPSGKGEAFALRTYVAWAAGNPSDARNDLRCALRVAVDHRHILPLAFALPAAALAVGAAGRTERAAELYALAQQQPYVGRSLLFAKTVEPSILALLSPLRPAQMAAAQDRGRLLDPWQTAQQLLQDIAFV